MKKLIAVLLALAGIFLFGCAPTIETSPEKQTPEAFVQQIYEGLADKSLTLYKVYNSFLSGESKAAFENIDYADRERERCAVLYQKDAVIESIESVVDGTFEDDITRVKTTLHAKIGEEISVVDCEDYVQETDGVFRLLYNGIISQKTYTMNTPSTSGGIHFSSVSLYICVDRTRVDVEVANTSLSRFVLGADAGAVLLFQTDAGEYPFTLPKAYKLGANEKISFKAEYTGVTGTPQKLSLQNIYTLGVLGNRIETDAGKTYSVSLQ